MNAIDIIIKKRDKKELSREEIEYFIQHYTKGDIADYQAAAWAMAVMLNGMTARETKDLTMAMVKSGEQLDFSSISSFVVDKHSTGGVGDKTTLAVAPMVAACGLPVGKMSGRGLGFSGGTIDKLESIPGFRANLTVKEFFNQLKEIGLVVSGQSVDLAPADGKLYALRDVTGTVPSLPLIASSIMSKKLAAGAHAIVLDVKTGLGAFMQTLEEAKQLARLMVEIAHLAEKEAIAVISDMNQPLGYAVGNALELIEAIDTLHGKGPRDFVEHCLVIAGYMLYLAKKVNNLEEGKRLALKTIEDGSAWKKFREMVSAQGGDVTTVDDVTKLPKARLIEKVAAQASGYILGIHAAQVGEAAVLLGAGREKKGDPIDYSVGVVLHCKVGDYVEKEQPLFTIHANSEAKLALAREKLLGALSWSKEKVPPLPLFYGTYPEEIG